MTGSVLFTVPISTGGQFECTSPAPQVYLLEFEAPPDNRLTTAFITAFLASLNTIETFPTGAVITTSKIAKFYSNGLDLEHVGATKGFQDDSLFPLFRRLLTFPMPTIALINGHAFAGGMLLAMYHDYRVMNPNKGFLCMNEITFGAPLDGPLSSIYRDKITSPSTYRSIVLEGRRFPAKAALDEQIIDATGGLDETIELIKQRGLTKLGSTGVYGAIKEEMYRESLGLLRSHEENLKWRRIVEGEKGASRLALGRAAAVAATKAKL